jgi:DNA-binding transcriptional MerR regulator
MVYTVNKLAKISGVSVRTLHFYDEISLLKPAYYGDNNYRYYEEEQLLKLQQILFFRELDFSLDDIKKIMKSDYFNQLKTLESHKHVLHERLDQAEKLIKTIDKTIEYLRGKINMKHEELYYGFDSEKQQKHEKNLVKQGIVTQEFLDECNEKIRHWTDKEKNDFIQEMEKIMDDLIITLTHKLQPSSNEVQTLIKKHYVWIKRSWTPTKESYIGLTQLYQTPEFRLFYDRRHPELLTLMVEAMQVFAERGFN